MPTAYLWEILLVADFSYIFRDLIRGCEPDARFGFHVRDQFVQMTGGRITVELRLAHVPEEARDVRLSRSQSSTGRLTGENDEGTEKFGSFPLGVEVASDEAKRDDQIKAEGLHHH
jgi:hypothetical protein